MDNTLLCIHEYLNTPTRRSIDQVKLFFSLNNQLELTINGRHISAGSRMLIVNHCDLYLISHAEQLVEMSIPVKLFTKMDKNFFNCYYNSKLINSDTYLKYQILTMIQQLSQYDNIDATQVSETITILNKEAKVECDYAYIPSVDSENTLLNKITTFIKAHITKPLLSKDVSRTFYISAPYISILFKKYLGMSFKHYITSLKIALSLEELVQNRQTIYFISEQYGFNHYSNYTHQFKQFLNTTPNEFRKAFQTKHPLRVTLINSDISDYQVYLNQLTSSKPQTINQYTIDLSKLTFNGTTKAPTLFIHVDNLMDIVQSDLNPKLNFKDLTKVYILINNSRKLALESLSLTGMIDFIDTLFSNYVGIAIRIKSVSQFDSIEATILQFLKYKSEYTQQKRAYNFLILLDAMHISLTDINRLYIRVKNLNVNLNIEVGITVEGVIEQSHNLKNAYNLLHRLHFDYYFLDIEQETVRTSLNKKDNHFHNDMSYFDYYNKVIEDAQIDNTKCVYTKLSKQGFNSYDRTQPLNMNDLMCHMLIMLNHGCGVGYELIRKEESDIALMNSHGIFEPLMYLYQFVRPFLDMHVAIGENYIVYKEQRTLHLLLFNAIHQILPTDDVQHYILKEDVLPSDITLFIQTLNREHGFIDYALPASFNNTYIDRSLLRYIEQSTIPKAEIRHHSRSETPLHFKLHYDEIKYIRILPT
ncbi:AraC family transcriptional regulator Rsp [Staphylococcus caeli]|uniref:Transcriptional regulator n=1 Tax=Staphylococcus caeli TaxID=2201815 RepID=A0A1D4L4E1_9STAP|nr:AraC family transcriptional regulator Rsp [Staphylococcus caeli]SCS81155.1 transcriptional regulator [Staphylococcus caeli]SCS93179.1 transcriptional regulator [Staphylococcus caeli]